MTLILDYISNEFVFQVSDRLLTNTNSQVFDSESNKTIVYEAKDAIISCSYSGLAFWGGKPTDQCLAEHLMGAKYEKGLRPALVGFMRLPYWHEFSEFWRSIKEFSEVYAKNVLKPPFRKLWRNMPFCIALSGWRWGRRNAFVPFIGKFLKRSGSEETQWKYKDIPTSVTRSGEFVFSWTPEENFSSPEKQVLLQEIKECRTFEAVENCMIRSLRGAAARLPIIGSDCISVAVYPPHTRIVVVKFSPLTPHRHQFQTSTETFTVPISYSPWVIGPRGVKAPSILAGGGMPIRLGRFNVITEAPKLSRPIFFTEGQQRPVGMH